MSSTVKVDTPEFTVEALNHTWRISNWANFKRNENEIRKATYSLTTFNPILARWTVGLLPDTSKQGKLLFTWTLTELEKSMSMVQAYITFDVIDKRDNTKLYRSKENKFVQVGQVNTITNGHGIATTGDWTPGYILDNYGRLHVSVKLKMILPNPPTKKNIAETALRIHSSFNFRRSQLALLNDNSSSDIKIVASDGIEIMAHKLILQAQCPVFASMFRSQFAESVDGIIQVNDLCGKVMHILLELFYTGELAASWCDPDVIVEFTYSAGKYQLTDILNMLDNVLGEHDDGKSFQNVVSLLGLVNKLGLKNAEKKLLDRVKKAVADCKLPSRFFMLLPFPANENVLEKEKIVDFVEMWEETLGEPTEVTQNAGHRDVLLLKHAMKKQLKKLESAVLKRIISTIRSFETADQLFALFENPKSLE